MTKNAMRPDAPERSEDSDLKPREQPLKDSDFEGLFVTVKANGSKLWHFKYRIGGKEKLLSFGMYPAISLAQVRAARDAARADQTGGDDSGEALQEAKQIRREGKRQTFAKLAEAFLSKATKEGSAPTTMAKNEWLLGMPPADFGRRPIADITAPMILRCLRKVEAKGNFETAKRLRAKIGAVFRYAVANGETDTDPTYALRDALIRPTVTPRAAITDPTALGALLRAIDGFNGQVTTRIALKLLAILVQRPGEFRHAK